MFIRYLHLLPFMPFQMAYLPCNFFVSTIHVYDSDFTSSIDGTVVQSDYKQDQLVSPETALAVVADTSNMYIGVNIEETQINKIKVGQSVTVVIDAYKGKSFQGVVREINNTTQTYFAGTSSFTTSGTYTKVTQLIPVKVFIENTEMLPMKLGMNATVKINLH